MTERLHQLELTEDRSETIGFTAVRTASAAERDALVGIAERRGRWTDHSGVSRARALRLVDEHPQVADTFAPVFPFLDPP